MSVQEERRGSAERLPFEALVVVANQESDAGAYECEAMDLSEHGMHLRTAYLPDLGQPLTFRFDGGSGEVVAEGTVIWRDEQAKGGEFGVRFTKMSPESLAAVREICGISEEGDAKDDAAIKATKGARVRLHIDGLGSPMRARIRDAQTGAVMVGSNLEFLKVGRSLDLEDVEAGAKKAAIIDRVEVEVDKETKIPQLVVTLKYEGEAGPATTRAEEPKKAAEKKVEAKDDDDDGDEESHDEDEKPSAFAGVAAGAKSFAANVGPKLAGIGASMRGAFSSLVDKARERRAENEGEGEGEKPRRVTSPPPEGALRASGRKVVRGENEDTMDDSVQIEEESGDETKAKKKKQAMMLAGAGFLVVLIAAFAMKSRASAPPGADPSAAASATSEVVATNAPTPAGQTKPMASGDSVTANVPLFGPTPLSTTEPAAMPQGAKPPELAGNLGAPQGVQGPTPTEAADAKGDADDDGEKSTQFGKGKVVKPKIARIKMDAPITDVKGSVAGNTVTISLPGRRNVEAATNLVKKDKRLASAKAVAKDDGVDVTLTFKDAVPPFLAKATGKNLEIQLGETPKGGADDEGAGEAHAKRHGKKKHAVAKKDDAGKKHHKKAKKHKSDD